MCWQDPPSTSYIYWAAANSHCDGLTVGGFTDWEPPSIDELVSLLRGCQNGTATGDLSLSTCQMTPAGCAATDSCESAI
ncbi:MAG: DUF1566 domain-containing protein [Deltaproteobacteria bacterium]|nr:DUF1566 domain-containing protein [Deltaproteobacteria bacterium]